MRVEKRTAWCTAAVLAAASGFWACAATKGEVRVEDQVDIPGLPPVGIEGRITIGEPGETTTNVPPSLVGTCEITDYYDAGGNPVGTTTTPVQSGGEISGYLPPGATFYRKVFGPWEDDGGEDAPPAPGGSASRTAFPSERGPKAHDWTVYGGPVFVDPTLESVAYACKVWADTEAEAYALVDAMVAAGVSAPPPPLVEQPYLGRYVGVPGGMAIRTALPGTALEQFALVVNGVPLAGSAFQTSVQNGWVVVDALVPEADLHAPAPGTTVENALQVFMKTDGSEEPLHLVRTQRETP